ncbi:MAG: LysM peptidoglycan-binding domain-containing protein [Spirochaetaceae bacterium]|nr:LysM peptidoglycan-binding domain-containing protein [Spirochaetaceae bacterium]
MDNPTIGIKIANGTYFPILNEEDRAKKKVVLSPVKENQKDVKIDIFRGEGEGMYEAIYVASLILNNINQEDGKVPDIELLLSVSDDRILDVQAFESVSGVKQFLSVSLDSIDNNIGFYDMQDTSSEDGISVEGTSFSSDFDDNSDEGESSEEDKGTIEEEQYSYEAEKENKKGKKGKKLIIILLILLLLLLGFLAYALIMKPALAKNSEKANSHTTVASAVGLKEMQEVKPLVVVEPTPVKEPEPTPVKEPEPIKPVETVKKPEDTKYIIKWGDTLWDISNTYYRTPWLYKKIAKDNNIRNPDLIYAGNRLTIKAE